MHGELSGKRVLVTGGTGFIGGRLVEKLLLEHHANVRVLLRNFAHALRIARYPVEMLHGEVTEASDIARAVEGCEIVVHCAYGNSGSDEMKRLVNVQGTRNVLEACVRAGVKRVVHLSTLQVYGSLADGDLDENAPRRYSGDVYSDSKLDAERIVLEYVNEYDLPAVILQPTVVYGPYSLIWTVYLLKSLKKERHILVDNGQGFCNAVYIDDVVDSILLAAVREQAVGESFLISGEQPVTWRDFYGGYERMLRVSATVSMSAPEAEAYDVKNQRAAPSIFKELLCILREESAVQRRLLGTQEIAILKGVARSVLPEAFRQSLKKRIKGETEKLESGAANGEERPIRLLSYPLDVKFYKAKASVHIDKAKRLLGYHPAFDLESGMKSTEEWARWANILDRQ